MSQEPEIKKASFLDELFNLNNADLYRAVNDLIEEGNPTGAYYMLLILSSIIIAAGGLLANSAILIGGMLVTPVLTPVLLVALAITTAKPLLLKRTIILILKSILVIVGVSALATLLSGVPSETTFFESTLFNDSLRAAFLYFVVACVSGVAATLSWVRKGEGHILPGISIAVSLVPPLSLSAMWLVAFDLERMRYFLLVFIFNFIGIVLGSLVIFSMLRVYRSGGMITSKVDTLIHKEEMERREKAIHKAAESITERET